MANLVTLQEVQAWGEKTKLAPAWVGGLDQTLLEQIQSEVLANIQAVVDTTTWTLSTTPTMVKTIIAKLYVAWLIDRQYSEDEELSAYAALLRVTALQLQGAISDGSIDLPGYSNDVAGDGLPGGYPTDLDPEVGPYFRMDSVF